MAAFETLLEVQAHDTAVDRLLHRREALPERRQLAEVADRLAALARRLQEVRARRDEVAGRQDHFERDLAGSEARIATIDKRMYSGEVSASRDLQAMAAEIESLRRRVSILEDGALATMEEREPLDAEVDSLEREQAALVERSDAVRRAIAGAEAAIDEEAAVVREARAALALGLPAELATTYERLRARLGGVGAARLVNASCTGCHLRLSAIEADRLKKLPADTLAFCEQCGRILVRSPAPTAAPAGDPP